MRRGTTPTITATVDADLTGMALYLAFKQRGCCPIVKSDDDLAVTVEDGVTTIVTTFTQQETLSMRADAKLEAQLRAVERNGTVAIATNIGSIDVMRILQEGVLDG